MAYYIFLGLALLLGTSSSAEAALTIKGIRYFSYPTFTRIVLEAEAAAPYVLTRSGDGRALLFSAYEGQLALKPQLPAINDGVVKNLELKDEGGRAFIYIHLGAAGEVKDFVLHGPDRIVLDIAKGAAPPAPAPPPKKTSLIALDPGHGGKDAGVVTSHGIEKAVTLEIANAVARLLKKKESSHAPILIRDKDQDMSLDERAAIANSSSAALFLSLHCAPGRGVRVYILEPSEKQTPQAAAVPKDFLELEAETEQREMLWGMQQAGHMRESNRLARKLLEQLTGKAGAAPVQAPMAVLKAVDAPAVLVEIGMEADRGKAAADIVRGIEQYVR